jgi:hypothetical protein
VRARHDRLAEHVVSLLLQEDEDLAGHVRDGGGRGAGVRRGGEAPVRARGAHQLPLHRRRQRPLRHAAREAGEMLHGVVRDGAAGRSERGGRRDNDEDFIEEMINELAYYGPFVMRLQ